jgi:hypothetical protein
MSPFFVLYISIFISKQFENLIVYYTCFNFNILYIIILTNIIQKNTQNLNKCLKNLYFYTHI